MFKRVMILGLVLSLSGCSVSEEDFSDDFGDVGSGLICAILYCQIDESLQDGNWSITFFDDSGNDDTSHFTGYIFHFNGDRTLTASNGTTNYEGSWGLIDTNFTYESLDVLIFSIDFDLSNDFEELDRIWHFSAFTETTIELIDIDEESGEIDYLIFGKN
jgi:hypothetical protein